MVGFSIVNNEAQGHSITVIDQSEDIKRINDTQDVKELLVEQHYHRS